MISPYPNPHALSCPWYDSAELFGAPNLKWCEASLCGWVSEPANTWSNVAYLLVALLVWLQCRRSAHLELRWMGPAMALMGLLSALYHASNNYLTQMFDFVGMYLLIFWLLTINLRRNGWIQMRRQVPVFVGLLLMGVLLVHLMYLSQLRFQVLIALISMAILITEFSARRDPKERVQLRNFWAGVALILLAQTASLADLNRVLCDPDNHWLQGHALWHLLSAAALYFSVQHYRQLRYPKPIRAASEDRL